MSPLDLVNLASWSVQAALVVAAALLTLRLLRLDAPSVRYLFLRAVLAIVLLLPLVQPRVVTAVTDAASARTVTRSGTGNGTSTAVDAGRREPPSAAGWFAVTPAGVMTVLATGTSIRLIWIALGVLRLRTLRRSGDVAPADRDHEALQSLIEASATIRYVTGLEQPVTFGVKRAVILLPESLTQQPPAIQHAVLAHELWHVRRADWLWTVIEETLRAVFWFHPAVWLLLSRIQATREEVVDELTVLATGSRRAYVHALLAYADRPALFAATAFARRSHLVERVTLISKEAVMSAKRVVACSAVLVGVVLSAGWYGVQAFPLEQQTVAAGQQALQGPGPVERRAKPVTPENPIPRRLHHVPADYPAEASAIGMRGTVTVRLVLDESGHLAETRVLGFALNVGERGRLTTTGASGSVEWKGTATGVTEVPPARGEAALRATHAAVLRAVQQWQYAAPAEGPIAFTVTVPVGAQATDAAASGTRAAPDGAVLSDGVPRVGGEIKPPIKVHHVSPVYPPDAQAARVQGVVILETRIEGDGTVSQVRVLRSVPMLDESAVEAVRQWRFTPTLLDGRPTPLIMTTTVNFTLD